uniref:alkaline ceramidase 2-like isoform X3 n=1 Tax=Ciona intestinalis TaxID=7719 RepID=UPI000EF46154|nr:alkaline ceramidase 2-like isoform X3 [Ciona intestinalis]|eukprot:XP_026696405.1 alkaline ceramidase 2-like isoform X3 [Ciona intestinalis]
MRLPSNIFAYHSSDVNWCEPDYEVSSFTIEFWNSISGIPMIVLSLIMISLNGDYTRLVPHCRYANVVWWLLAVTGVGSIYFHATLSLFGQFLDEIGIIWLGFAVLAMYAEPSVVFLPSSFNKNRTLYQSLMLAAAIVATTLSFVEPKFNHVWLFLFVVPVVRGVTMKKARNLNMEKFQALGRNGLVFLALAVICWVLDRVFCPFMLSIRFPYLHAVWHILVLIAANMVFVFGAFDYANQTASRHEPYLAFVPLLGSYVGIWYVAFRLPNRKST